MKRSEEAHHLAKWSRQLESLYDADEVNDRRLKAIENHLREAAIFSLKPITPPTADLKDFDYAASFCHIMPKNPEHELYGDALTLLRMCNLYLERGRVEKSGMQELLLLYAGSDKAEETKKLLEQSLPIFQLFSKNENADEKKTVRENTTQEKEENFIHRNGGNFWEVGYRGKKGIVRGVSGMNYIVTLIEKHGNSVSCQELHQAISGKMPDNIMSEGAAIGEGLNTDHEKQEKNDPEAQKNYMKQYEKLQNDLNAAESEMERHEIETEMEMIMACLKEKVFVDPNHKKAQANINKRLNKAYEEINRAGMNEMAKYLQEHIKADGAYGLSYIGSATWETIK